MRDIQQLRFTKSHEWIAPDGTVGISDHAQKEVTDVVFVELPPIGKDLAQEGEAATIESVKAAFPIYAPAAGKVRAVNAEVARNPALVNQSPYGDGWLFQLEGTDAAQVAALMSHGQYQDFLKTEAVHH